MQSIAIGKARRQPLKVGDLAKRAGVSVRTLHYYDQMGLLSPSEHTAVGHRLYTDADIARLQQILSLRQIGLSLDEVRRCLDWPGVSLQGVLALHIDRLRQQIELQSKLCVHLQKLLSGICSTGNVSVEELIETMEVIRMTEKSFSPDFTPDEMAEIRQRGEMLGPDSMSRVQAEWAQLIEDVRNEMDKGTDPLDPKVKAMARHWMDLVSQFTGGNPEIFRKLDHAYEADPTAGGRLDPRMREYMAYISTAMSASS